jgi:hypothetical protein
MLRYWINGHFDMFISHQYDPAHWNRSQEPYWTEEAWENVIGAKYTIDSHYVLKAQYHLVSNPHSFPDAYNPIDGSQNPDIVKIYAVSMTYTY